MLFKKKKKQTVKIWNRPGGMVPDLHLNILKENHVLIAGSTGSGKSVFVSGVIHALLHFAPCEKYMILIDPKMVDYIEYAAVPHCLGRATTPDQVKQVLQIMVNLMLQRLQECQKNGVKITPDPDIYIIVDEYPDIVQTNPAAVKLIEKISRLGRAAKIHLIICTQRNTKDIINGVISANMTAKVALKTVTAQESKNILSIPDAALLPQHGKCIYYSPAAGEPLIYNVPMIPDAERIQLINFWINQNK